MTLCALDCLLLSATVTPHKHRMCLYNVLQKELPLARSTSTLIWGWFSSSTANFTDPRDGLRGFTTDRRGEKKHKDQIMSGARFNAAAAHTQTEIHWQYPFSSGVAKQDLPPTPAVSGKRVEHWSGAFFYYSHWFEVSDRTKYKLTSGFPTLLPGPSCKSREWSPLVREIPLVRGM